MREVAAEVGMAHEADADYAELDLVEYAGRMTRSQRARVYEAFRLAGYGTIRSTLWRVCSATSYSDSPSAAG